MFNFFKVVPTKSFFQHRGRIVAYCGNYTYKVFCYDDSIVQIFWRDWDCITLHIKDVKFCCIPDNSDYLVVLSQNAITSKITLNLYNISTQFGRKSGIIISTSNIDSNSTVTALSSIYLSESQLCLTIGLESGYVLFYKNTLQKEIVSNAFYSFNVTTKPIKGIRFSKHGENINMFVCSDAGIFCFKISKNLRLLDTKLNLDDMDSSIHSITFKPSSKLAEEQYLIVARDNGLYCYTAEGRGPCYAINGHKKSVEWFGKYLVILLQNKCLYSHQTTSHVLIYDIDNKIIVMDKQLDEVVCILPISGHTNCLIILENGEMYSLKEKEMRYKLTCVMNKKLYDLALKLLEDFKVSHDVVSEILLQSGDCALQRGDSSGAINAYTKTIGSVPPFLIIKKLKDFRYNEVLMQYLSKLVQTDFKLPEHLDLLQNCLRRINLPRSTCRLFEMEDIKYQQQYIYFATINHNLNVTLIINYLKQGEYFSPYFFYEYSNEEVMKFLSEYGYYLIKEYPTGFKELTKYSLSDRFLKNIFQQTLLPLSLMNKLYAPYFIENLLNGCENVSAYSILTELVLQMWSKGVNNTNFVIEFLKSNQLEIGTDNIFVLCRHYEFWPGIKMMYDKCCLEALSTHCLAKCLENFPDYEYIFCPNYNNRKLYQMVQTLKKENMEKAYTLKYITGIAKTIIASNPQCILNMLYSFDKSSEFLLSHLDEFLVQEFFLTYFKCDELYRNVKLLENRVVRMEEMVDNYLTRPIEFRNRSCDICKHIIKQPSFYFLCQHAFHRECLIQMGENNQCHVCADKQRSSMEAKNSIVLKDKIDINPNENDMIAEISKNIERIFKSNHNVSALEDSQQFKNMEKFVRNEYDDNLNPFKQT